MAPHPPPRNPASNGTISPHGNPLVILNEVGVSWRSFSDFENFSISSKLNSLLQQEGQIPSVADSMEVPGKMFLLEDLHGVLNSKTWREFLTSEERKKLRELLPPGINPDFVLDSLFKGENIHFGNPLQQWGSAVCRGDYRSDKIKERDKMLQKDRRRYIRRLHLYHLRMVEMLKRTRNVWEAWDGPPSNLPTAFKRCREQFILELQSKNPSDSYPFGSWLTEKGQKRGIERQKEQHDKQNETPPPVRRRVDEKQPLAIKQEEPLRTYPPIKPKTLLSENFESRSASPFQKPNMEIPNEPGRKVMLSKEKWDEVARRRQSGEEVRWDPSRGILAPEPSSPGPLLSGRSDSLTSRGFGERQGDQKKLVQHWHTLVNTDMPAVYALMREEREHQCVLARWLAEQCKVQRKRLRHVTSQEKERRFWTSNIDWP